MEVPAGAAAARGPGGSGAYVGRDGALLAAAAAAPAPPPPPPAVAATDRRPSLDRRPSFLAGVFGGPAPAVAETPPPPQPPRTETMKLVEMSIPGVELTME